MTRNNGGAAGSKPTGPSGNKPTGGSGTAPSKPIRKKRFRITGSNRTT